MQDIRAVWPCLVKLGQRYIACFETLAQLPLLQATHSHIGGGHYSFSMPSGTDNSATEASLNKLFTTSWPLQLFVQLTAFWAHARNVLLQPTHVPGRNNDWADDLSRGRLARFSHRPDIRVRLRCQAEASSCVRLMRPGTPSSCCQLRVDKPCCLPTGVATRHRPGNQNIWLHLSAASQQAALAKMSSPRTANAHKRVNAMSCDICPARYNPTLRGGDEAGGPAGSLIPGLPETLKGGSTHLLLQAHPCPGSSATFSNPG